MSLVEEFYKVPWTNDIAITKTGIVKNVLTGNVLKPLVRNHGYYSYNVLVNGRKRQLLLHRLLAETFIPIPEELDRSRKLQVNHKDGNKLNIDLSNLEWIRPQQNMQHAFRTGLINIGRILLARNILTEEITKYNSIASLALELDISSRMLRRHLNSDLAGKRLINFRVFKYDDGKEWPYVPKNHKVPTTFGANSMCITKNIETGFTTLSNNVREYCQINNINYHAVQNHFYLNGKTEPFQGKLIFTTIDDFSDIDIDSVIKLSIRGKDKDKRLFEITDKDNNIVKISGVLELSKFLQYDNTYVGTLINSGKEFIGDYKVKEIFSKQNSLVTAKV